MRGIYDYELIMKLALFFLTALAALAQPTVPTCVSFNPFRLGIPCATLWGQIGGTIGNQADLQAALATKLNANAPAVTAVALAKQCPAGQYSDGVGCLPLPAGGVTGLVAIQASTLVDGRMCLPRNLTDPTNPASGDGTCYLMAVVWGGKLMAMIPAQSPLTLADGTPAKNPDGSQKMTSIVALTRDPDLGTLWLGSLIQKGPGEGPGVDSQPNAFTLLRQTLEP